ncbi:MAG: BrnA antitoxin family protein [Clostridiales Family XIII bacterium]|jgi:uncharacterized protein (DUF4415 family)|nr:BrnA antitoxin family protein [Clostridiales Family XIII bacterium]
MSGKVNYTDAPSDIDEALDAAIANDIKLKLSDLSPKPKQRVNIMLDRDVVLYFKEQAKKHGGRYQTMINGVLAAYAKRLQS